MDIALLDGWVGVQRFGVAGDPRCRLPAHQVAALVGPHGAGRKTTLRHGSSACCGPTPTGRGSSAGRRTERSTLLSEIRFVARSPTVSRLHRRRAAHHGPQLNLRWDTIWPGPLANLDIPLDKPIGKLSGGRGPVALVLALAKQPRLLLLDVPLGPLDPLARREFLQALMDAASPWPASSVLLSSHILADLDGSTTT